MPKQKKAKTADLILNCVEFHRDEGMECLLFKDGIDEVVEPKGKGWRHIDAGEGWDVAWARSTRR